MCIKASWKTEEGDRGTTADPKDYSVYLHPVDSEGYWVVDLSSCGGPIIAVGRPDPVLDAGVKERLGRDETPRERLTRYRSDALREARRWISIGFSPDGNSARVRDRKKRAQPYLKRAVRTLGLPSDVLEDALNIVAEDVFIDLPIRFGCVCGIAIAAWEAGVRPSLTLSECCRAVGTSRSRCLKIEYPSKEWYHWGGLTGYLPSDRTLYGDEDTEDYFEGYGFDE